MPKYNILSSEEAFLSGSFYLVLEIIVFLLSKPLSKLICINLKD